MVDHAEGQAFIVQTALSEIRRDTDCLDFARSLVRALSFRGPMKSRSREERSFASENSTAPRFAIVREIERLQHEVKRRAVVNYLARDQVSAPKGDQQFAGTHSAARGHAFSDHAVTVL